MYDWFYVQPQVGLIVLFPSHVTHSVTQNNSNEDRISCCLQCELQMSEVIPIFSSPLLINHLEISDDLNNMSERLIMNLYTLETVIGQSIKIYWMERDSKISKNVCLIV